MTDDLLRISLQSSVPWLILELQQLPDRIRARACEQAEREGALGPVHGPERPPAGRPVTTIQPVGGVL